MVKKIDVDALPGSLKNFDQLPDDAYVRLPTVKILYACSSASVWRGVKTGKIPTPRKISERVTAWRVGSLRESLASA